MFDAVHFLEHQGLSLRGYDDAEGNLQQTLKLVQQDSDALRAWMSHSHGFTSAGDLSCDVGGLLLTLHNYTRTAQ